LKILITGADGLLGANLVRELLSRGYSVRAVIQPGSKSVTLDKLPIEKVECDLLDDGDRLLEAISGCGAVIHAAAITDMWAAPDLTWRVNLDGTKKVLDACVKAGIKKILYVGSASSFQFGTIERPGDEEAPFPRGYKGFAYMESKFKASQLVKEYARRHGLWVVVVCPTFMFGPYDSRPSSGELIRQFVIRQLKFTTKGGRNFVYVGDVAKAAVNALEKGQSGSSYILGGENLTYSDFFGKVAKKAGIAPPMIVLPAAVVLLTGFFGSLYENLTGKRALINSPLALNSTYGTYYSPARAIKELDMPQTPIDRAIEESMESLKQYGHLNPQNERIFEGKVALITGASRGVGFATASELVRKGAKVVITARGERRLTDSKEKLEAIGGEVAAVAGDVGKWEDAKKMVETAVARFGRLDFLINNAGVSMRGRFDEISPEVCAQVAQTDFMGCVYPTKAAINHIIASRGSVVFISSIAGLFGLPNASIYCASKKALTGFAESLRIELIPKGVHVGVVYLGFTEHDPEKRILAADGALVPPDRPSHHSQAQAACLIVKMLEKRKKQQIMTPIGVLGWFIYRLSPSIIERAILFAQSSQSGIFQKFS